MATTKGFSVNIRGMEVANFNLAQRTDIELTEYQYNFFVQSRIQENENLLLYSASIKVFNKDALDIELCSLEIIIAFEIREDFKKLVKKLSEVSFNINEKLDKTLTLICLNTLRGVAFSLFRNSYLQNIVLPYVDDSGLQKVPIG